VRCRCAELGWVGLKGDAGVALGAWREQSMQHMQQNAACKLHARTSTPMHALTPHAMHPHTPQRSTQQRRARRQQVPAAGSGGEPGGRPLRQGGAPPLAPLRLRGGPRQRGAGGGRQEQRRREAAGQGVLPARAGGAPQQVRFAELLC